ncbi:MAG TPA: MarR family transcriptional regulator [Desulfobacteraceae bacterium]|nr:MarR family transcriptional regulator [Desulfobacteraceae bacterium]
MFFKFAPESIGRRINHLFRLSRRHLSLEMKNLDVGAGDYAFIAMLFIQDGQSQDELSRNMQVDKSYTARAVAKLEKMGLVERRPDPDEHRMKRVFLTREARAKENAFFTVFKGWHDVLVKDIPPGELAIILNGLDKMLENGRQYLGLEEPDEIFSRKNK